MPLDDNTEYRFPDELESKGKPEQNSEPEIEIEIEDDTPTEDRGRQPLPKPLVEELERDELDQYDDNVKEKLKQMRKVWHDERREKEAALREQQETLTVAQKLLNENKRIREILVRKNTSLQYSILRKCSLIWPRSHTRKPMTQETLTG